MFASRYTNFILVGAVCLIVGGTGGWFLRMYAETQLVVTRALRQSDITPDNTYRYIDPLLGLKNFNQAESTVYASLQHSVSNLISSAQRAGTLSAASVTFRDVSISEGFTIDPTEQYSPASLLKVPLMMAYFKAAQSNPSILLERLTYRGRMDANLQEHFISDVTLTPGTSYTIAELIEHMIRYSDNNAAQLLTDYLNDSPVGSVYATLFEELGIQKLDLNNDFITIQAYALFFRVLYNATYLDRDMSERAMELLAQTDFTQGIMSGMSNNTPVAHKFGEFTLQTPNGAILKQELHDCGYIYAPEHTYFLCIMTKGNDLSQLQKIVSGISSLISGTVQ